MNHVGDPLLLSQTVRNGGSGIQLLSGCLFSYWFFEGQMETPQVFPRPQRYTQKENGFLVQVFIEVEYNWLFITGSCL